MERICQMSKLVRCVMVLCTCCVNHLCRCRLQRVLIRAFSERNLVFSCLLRLVRFGAIAMVIRSLSSLLVVEVLLLVCSLRVVLLTLFAIRLVVYLRGMFCCIFFDCADLLSRFLRFSRFASL